jgi:hypothetical protein
MSDLATGIISSVFTLIGSYFVFKQNDKSNQLKYITEERAKWREKIRELSVEFLTKELHIDNSIIVNPKINELSKIRHQVAVRLNPNDDQDNKLLKLMSEYISLFIKYDDSELEKKRNEIQNSFAELLKHDWDRAKAESKEKRVINLLELILLGTLSFQTFVIYNKSIGFTNSILKCEILVYISKVIVTFTFYFILKGLIRVFKNDIEKALNKPSSLSNFLGLIVRTKIK